MIFAIGRPGGPVRIFIEIDLPGREAGAVDDGEVAVSVEQRVMGATISPDGSAVDGGDDA